jgi:hypothetical protein
VYIKKSPGFPQPQQTIIINVTIADVTNLNSWEMKISFDSRILNCEGIIIPSDNIFRGYSTFNHSEIKNDEGIVRIFCATDAGYAASGSGTLCQIRFTCLDFGATNLHFVDPSLPGGCYLHDPSIPAVEIPFDAVDKVIEVVPSNSQVFHFTHTQGSTTYYINVIANKTATTFSHNYAFKEMSFNLTGTQSTIGFCLVEIPKALLNNTVLALINDSPYRMFSQSFNTLPENSTYCIPSFPYTQTRNSVKIKIRLTIPGDLTGDRTTDISDVALAAFGFGVGPGHPRWYDAADINFDNFIDITDIAAVAFYFGESM